MGEETEFESDSHYARKGPDDVEWQEEWRSFEHGLKTEARFFSRSAYSTLASVFSGLVGHKTVDGRPVLIEAGPEAEIKSIYRARVFQSASKLELALVRPDREVGPPPSISATAGRMNARGISVFYGALDPAIAIAEVRPPVGSRVVVGRFELLRSVRLLDVEALRSLYVAGSVFDPDFIGRLELAKFLERLSHRITMPIMPDDELSDYLVTQAIADYLANEVDPRLDGILYPSVQKNGGSPNVALFHKAARVTELGLPKGTESSAYVIDPSDDGPEAEYWVSEEVSAKSAATPDQEHDQVFSVEFTHDAPPITEDYREETLRLDLNSLKVHHVETVLFTTTDYPVTRHRLVLGAPLEVSASPAQRDPK